MKIIDIHTHIYPEDIAQKATNSVRAFYNIGTDGMDGTEAVLLRQGKEAGISQFVILPVAIRPDRVQGINDFIVDRVAKNDALIGFGTVHAAMDNMEAEVQRIMDLGLHGIKMHPDSQRFSIDDERLFPVFEQVQGKLPIMFHMGDRRYDYSHPARLKRVLELFPRLQVIAAHFGGYSMYEEAYVQLKGKDCFFDVSSSLMFMDEGVAESYINRYGAERFVYGSDYPMWDPQVEMERFLKLKLSDSQREQIAHKTAEYLLNI